MPGCSVGPCPRLRLAHRPSRSDPGAVARKLRVEAPGATHHVVAKGVGGSEIVADDADRRSFIARLARTVESHRWSCLAYCLLDTHFHLVVTTPEPNLGVGMKWLKAAYAQDFNHRHGRQGHVFGGRFYSEAIGRDAHLVAAIVYVALNPVRAGIVDRPERWPWSSYAATVGVVPAPELLNVRGSPGARAPPSGRRATHACGGGRRDGATGRWGQTRGV